MGGIIGGGGGGGSAPAPQTTGNPGGVDYTPVSKPSYYTPSYAPQSATPLLQSVMAQHGAPLPQSNNLGLPSLQSMFGMQQGNQPYPGGIQQLRSMAPYVGSTYRPDMSGAMAKLNDVNPSVATEQARAAAAKAKWDAEHPVQQVEQSYGGGGD